MQVIIKPFTELTTGELYRLLQLRSAVFVVEQDCVYQDVDGKDQKAHHVLGYSGGQLVAYARIFGPGDYFTEPSIGRVVVAAASRKNDYGRKVMVEGIAFAKANYPHHPIKISAQCYLDSFYSELGFKKIGTGYLEDGIPHQAMLYGIDK